MFAVEQLQLLKHMTLQFVTLLRNGTSPAVAGIFGQFGVGILAIKQGEKLG